jgi:hypothetical protein
MILKNKIAAIIYRDREPYPCTLTGLDISAAMGVGLLLASIIMDPETFRNAGGEISDDSKSVILPASTTNIKLVDPPEELHLSGYARNVFGEYKHYDSVVIATKSFEWYQEDES